MRHLLFLHGAMGAQSEFNSLMEKLGKEYQCHSLDFYGHGQSSFGAQFGIDVFAEQTMEYIRQYDIKGCDVFGYSMGGYVALFLEQANPGTFRSIMTLGTKLQWTQEGSEKEASRLNPEVMEEKVPEYVDSLKKLHGDKWKELCIQTANMMRYLGNMPLVTLETLADIRIPVRLGIGDLDRMVTLDETVAAFRVLRKGSFLVMPTTPHPLAQVNKDRLAYKIEKFLET
ncbi:MAG: alpha/beta fold hydrolase [Bacteroidetes bacterium]|nr:alpha/beta fold hydrolase [Bacteroidota bacterium]